MNKPDGDAKISLETELDGSDWNCGFGGAACLPTPASLSTNCLSLTGELDGLQALLRTSPTVTQRSLERQIQTDRIARLSQVGRIALFGSVRQIARFFIDLSWKEEHGNTQYHHLMVVVVLLTIEYLICKNCFCWGRIAR